MHSQSAMPPADAASTVVDVLSARMQEVPVRGQDDARDAGLLVYLGRVPDRRRVRGRRHQLTAILALACGAVTAGAKSLTAIAEWAAAAPAAVLAAFGVRRDRRDGTWVVPSETTIRRTLGGIDADALDAQVGAWLLALAGYGADEDAAGDQMVIAVDGKTARGAKDKDGTAPHLLAAITCDEVAAIAQQQVSAKSNEIPAFAPLLQDLDLDGAVILADALHTQREHARFIVQDNPARSPGHRRRPAPPCPGLQHRPRQRDGLRQRCPQPASQLSPSGRSHLALAGHFPQVSEGVVRVA